jgi:hypothetical protein
MRSRNASLFLLLTLGLALGSGCSSDNSPSNEASGASGGTGGSGASGGSSGTAAGTGGSSGSSGSSGSGGSGGSDTQNFMPPCSAGPTLAGDEIKKGTVCTPSDVELCYRPCGPTSVGWKPETCTSGVYAEGDCTFPVEGDYSCFKIPDTIDAAVCPTTTPQSGMDCTVPECTLCNLDGMYFDSTGSSKTGYCVCQAPNDMGARHWSCASDTAWPCPINNGC